MSTANHPPDPPPILVPARHNELRFLRSQKLFELRPGVNAREALRTENFRGVSRRGEKEGNESLHKRFWRPISKREDFVEDIRSGSRLRVILTTDAGTGKSYNLASLDFELNREGGPTLAFNLNIGGLARLTSAADLIPEVLLEIVRNAGSSSADPDRILSHLRRKQVAGKIVLLFDGLDQAGRGSVDRLAELVNNDEWRDCPIVIAGRRAAIERRENQEQLFESKPWEYVQIGEFDEGQQRRVLGKLADRKTDRYDRIPEDAREILTVPRVLEFLHQLPEAELADIETTADVYWKSIGHMLARALKTEKLKEIDRFRTLLGALAFGMYARTERDPESRELYPNLDRIPAVQVSDFLDLETYPRMKQSFSLRGRPEYSPEQFDGECEALCLLNEAVNHGWLEGDAGRPTVDLVWRNASLQEFLAAYWAVRWGTPDDHALLRGWLVNPLTEHNNAFYEFWRYATEMPDEALATDRPAKVTWVAAMAPLYDQSKVRSTEFIYRSWERMAGTAPRRRFLAEFQELRDGKGGTAEQQGLAVAMMKSFVKIDGGTFMMGAPANEPGASEDEKPAHKEPVSAFRLHRDCVTNEEYELFDPGHRKFRWAYWEKDESKREHPLSGKDGRGDDRCPVVNVSWYDAFCFAAWCGCRLPEEKEWEYAARGGRGNGRPFFWGRELNGTQANCDGNRPYGTANKGQYLGHTCPVEFTNERRYEEHPWDLRHILGNVWEWCADWYDEGAYSRNEDDDSKIIHTYRVLRGGSWYYFARFCSAAYRCWYVPWYRDLDVGFRLRLPGPD